MSTDPGSFLTPPSNFSLVQCDWRVTLDPRCPYVGETRLTSEILLWSCLGIGLLQWAALIYRRGWKKRKLFQKGKKWYLPLHPLESVCWSVAIYHLVRFFQSLTLVYFNDTAPPFLKGFLYGGSHAVGMSAMAYYWIALVAALPSEGIVDDTRFLAKISPINTALGLVTIPLSIVPAFLEGTSAHYMETNEPLSRALLTASFSLWCALLVVLGPCCFLFGSRIYKILEASVKMNEEKSKLNPKTFKRLKLAVSSLRPTVLLLSGLANSTLGICLVMAIARYYVWAYREASLTFCILLNFTPTIFTAVLTVIVNALDFRGRGKKSLFTTDGSTTSQTRSQSQTHIKTEETPMQTNRERAVRTLSQSQTEDEILESFRAEVS